MPELSRDVAQLYSLCDVELELPDDEDDDTAHLGQELKITFTVFRIEHYCFNPISYRGALEELTIAPKRIYLLI